jgi:hypothetical protein
MERFYRGRDPPIDLSEMCAETVRWVVWELLRWLDMSQEVCACGPIVWTPHGSVCVACVVDVVREVIRGLWFGLGASLTLAMLPGSN